jgi:hypothetical protein
MENPTRPNEPEHGKGEGQDKRKQSGSETERKGTGKESSDRNKSGR